MKKKILILLIVISVFIVGSSFATDTKKEDTELIQNLKQEKAIKDIILRVDNVLKLIENKDKSLKDVAKKEILKREKVEVDKIKVDLNNLLKTFKTNKNVKDAKQKSDLLNKKLLERLKIINSVKETRNKVIENVKKGVVEEQVNRQFISIATKSGNIFYLILDHNTNDVKFLTEVKEQDLLDVVSGSQRQKLKEAIEMKEKAKEEDNEIVKKANKEVKKENSILSFFYKYSLLTTFAFIIIIAGTVVFIRKQKTKNKNTETIKPKEEEQRIEDINK